MLNQLKLIRKTWNNCVSISVFCIVNSKYMHTDATAFKNIKANSISVTNYFSNKKCGIFSKNTERNQYSK